MRVKGIIIKSFAIFFITISIVVIVGIINLDQKATTTNSSQIVSERVLIPGGQSIGIKMDVKGALVVGVENDFGPEVGDMITAINNNEVDSASDIENMVYNLDSKVKITILRKNKKIDFETKPIYDATLKKYKLGLWVKEKIAGIGTLSFYDSKTGKYAALGHGIYEPESNTLLTPKNGQLMSTEVESVTEGTAGKPGEIKGQFYNCDVPIGTITRNSTYGIYGNCFENKMKLDLSSPMVMGYQDQIKVGNAYILTTIDGTNVEKFDIKITKVNHQRKINSKGIEFTVTDEKLIKECGGIIQGMSGSPIIQNNRIIGVVTHVLMDEPLNGYGIFAQWMIEELEIN